MMERSRLSDSYSTSSERGSTYPELDTVGELKKRRENQRGQGKRTLYERDKKIFFVLLHRER
jgi:hypothetical protein